MSPGAGRDNNYKVQVQFNRVAFQNIICFDTSVQYFAADLLNYTEILQDDKRRACTSSGGYSADVLQTFKIYDSLLALRRRCAQPLHRLSFTRLLCICQDIHWYIFVHIFHFSPPLGGVFIWRHPAAQLFLCLLWAQNTEIMFNGQMNDGGEGTFWHPLIRVKREAAVGIRVYSQNKYICHLQRNVVQICEYKNCTFVYLWVVVQVVSKICLI